MSELSLDTRVAHAFWDDHYWFGKMLYAELLGTTGYTGLLARALGRELDAEGLAMLEDLGLITCVADPRIWPMKIIRLVAAYGNAFTAHAIGNLVMEHAMIGPHACGRSAALLADMQHTLAERSADRSAIEEECVRRFKSMVPPVGFGVPFRPIDERVVAIRRAVKLRGRADLPSWRFFELLSEVLAEKRRFYPNVGSALSAACLDLGFAAEAIGPLALGLVQNTLLANAIEGAEQSPMMLRRLPEAAVGYEGRPPRESPRALRRAGSV
jgi:hypothetical protein